MTKSLVLTKTASILIGAFFLLFTTSCTDRKSTEDWQQPDAPENNTSPTGDDGQAKILRSKPPHGNEATPVRFLCFNLRNYLTMPRYANNQRRSAPKPEDEILALIDIIKEAQPDIMGLCEIGSPEDLKDLQSRLSKEGIHLPHTHHLLGFDSVRTLAILSKFPIVTTANAAKVDYQVGDIPFRMSRGILDATIQFPLKQIRFLGVHLKSKRPVPEADQELMRRAESGLLRRHIDQILEDNPDTHLIVYGDFNDSKRAPTLRTAMGRLNSKAGLVVLHPKDSRGDLWTHHWARENIYSRFDYVMVSKGMEPFIDKKKMRILDPAHWETASDHRAILVPIR